MPRIARVVVPGIPHHIIQRGVRSMNIFFNDEDRQNYLHLLHLQGSIHGLHYATYVLMDNHVHLVAIPENEESLRKAIGETHRLYTLGINRRLDKRGYLFQGRPFSCPMDEEYFFTAVRYVERNPVRAKIVKQPWEYFWSGARFHLGLTNTDPIVDVDCHSALGLNKEQWREFLRVDSPETHLLQVNTRTGRPCGTRGFIDELERRTGRILNPYRPGRKKRKTSGKSIVSPYSSYG
jgi:putative transposase